MAGFQTRKMEAEGSVIKGIKAQRQKGKTESG
jgi:hypothetical protein